MAPLTVHLAITNRCNLSCRHCFAQDEMKGPVTEMDLAQMTLLFDELADMGCMRVALTGGEPFMRQDIFEIIDAINGRGIEVCLTTNGFFLNASTVEQLRARDYAWINVSLEGTHADVNDSIRGHGSFNRVVDNLMNHCKGQIDYGLSVTIHKGNIAQLKQLPRFARSLGAEVIMLRNLYPIGAANSAQEIAVGFGEYQRAVKSLTHGFWPTRVVPTSCEPLATESDPAIVFQQFGCAAGNTVATVYANGDVSPCSLIGDGVELDNLHDKTFREIWHDGVGFRHIRNIHPPTDCIECTAYESCAGGCRARAYQANNSLSAIDPWCTLAT